MFSEKERTINKPPYQFPLNTQENAIAIYTVLAILNKMKNQLGLEAMLEYLENFLSVIEKYNPKIKWAVAKALEVICVEKMYKKIKT